MAKHLVRDASQPPQDRRASIAIDLGAESCRVSLLRWVDNAPHIQLVCRFPNAPEENDGLRWPLARIEAGLDEGMRRSAELAPEGIRSVAVDGWAVDYVRVTQDGRPLSDPFCYRDDRTAAAEQKLHQHISVARMQQITAMQLSRINTLYQLYADRMMGLDLGDGWVNLPEYMLTRWGAPRIAEYTNASHSQLLDAHTRAWSREIFDAAGLSMDAAPAVVAPGTRLGYMRGPLTDLPAFAATELIAPACHDTASAVAGISLSGQNWAYICSGTWSLIGTRLPRPCDTPESIEDGFTSLGAIGGQICFHKAVNGMWLIKQCMEAWSIEGAPWRIEELIAAASLLPAPSVLLDMEDPELLRAGDMPARLDSMCRRYGAAPLDLSSTGAPHMAALIMHSLAAEYAKVIDQLEALTRRSIQKIVIVGGGAQNDLLLRLTAQRTGRQVVRGATESSTIGNFAVQLAVLEGGVAGDDPPFAAEVAAWAACLNEGSDDHHAIPQTVAQTRS